MAIGLGMTTVISRRIGAEKQFPIPRKKNQSREKGYIKNIWCPFCKKVEAMKEYRSFEAEKNGLGERIDITEIQEPVKEDKWEKPMEWLQNSN
ncbi:MAG: hypothetical protein ACOX1S_12380 [Anaerostipes sp.]